jgi:two-component system sensor histidine kinase KdpD
MNGSKLIKILWMKIRHNRIVIIVCKLLGTMLCIGLMTFIFHLFEPFLAIQYIALLYLLPVMICTVLWGITAGILSAFLSFLAFNYFFIQPFFSLWVHESQDLITLTLFLIVATVMSQLIGQARDAAREAVRMARLREWEATCMYQLISALSGLTDTSDIAQVLVDHMLDTFHFVRVEILIKGWEEDPAVLRTGPASSLPETSPNSTIMLTTARKTEGEIHIWYQNKTLSNEESRLLQAFCDQGALAIERIHLTKVENKARVLEESDRIKTSLLNSVSHELRTPLAAIKASVSSLRIGAIDWDSAARVELLTTMEEETDQLNLLVGNLLDMSRIEAGALNPHINWNSVPEIAMSVTTKMRSRLQDHPIIYNFPNNLPLVPTDFVMMEQVFTNLISNSIKYAPASTNILISGKEQEDFLLFSVENQSPPVPDEHLEHIFDKFHRITQADKVTGTGLGLSICKGIIEAHGGKIWAENLADGFSFFFTLPRKLNGALPETPKDS